MSDYVNSNISVAELANQIEMDVGSTPREKRMIELLQDFISEGDEKQDEIDDLNRDISELEGQIAELDEKLAEEIKRADEAKLEAESLQARIDEMEAAQGDAQE